MRSGVSDKDEIFSMAAKMFTVAGPVIVNGTAASVIYGIILALLQSF